MLSGKVTVSKPSSSAAWVRGRYCSGGHMVGWYAKRMSVNSCSGLSCSVCPEYTGGSGEPGGELLVGEEFSLSVQIAEPARAQGSTITLAERCTSQVGRAPGRERVV